MLAGRAQSLVPTPPPPHISLSEDCITLNLKALPGIEMGGFTLL